MRASSSLVRSVPEGVTAVDPVVCKLATGNVITLGLAEPPQMLSEESTSLALQHRLAQATTVSNETIVDRIFSTLAKDLSLQSAYTVFRIFDYVKLSNPRLVVLYMCTSTAV